MRELGLFQARQRQLDTHLIFPKDPHPRPGMKPVALLREFSSGGTRRRGTILDAAWGGAGVCCTAAWACGRHFIGIEARRSAFDDAVQLLASQGAPTDDSRRTTSG